MPGQPGTLLFSQRDSDQLLQTSMPADAVVDPSASSVHASRVWVSQEVALSHTRSASSLTALAVSADGGRAGVGHHDGSVAF